jgi:hypothetical protein
MDIILAYPQLTWSVLEENSEFAVYHGVNADSSVLLCPSISTYFDLPQMTHFCEVVTAFWRQNTLPTIQIMDIRVWAYVCSLSSLSHLRRMAFELHDIWEDYLLFTTLLIFPSLVTAMKIMLNLYTPVRPISVTSRVECIMNSPKSDDPKRLHMTDDIAEIAT